MNLHLRECELVYRPTSDAAQPTVIRSSECVYALFAEARLRVHESLWVVLLDARSRVIGTHEAARGGISAVQVDAGAIFRAAIVSGAPALLLVHNHPSGDPTPSPEDIALTRRVQQGALLLGLSLLDHVVVAQQGYASLLDMGLLRSTGEGA